MPLTMMHDLTADMLTRIRNALHRRKQACDVLATKVNLGIARVLKDEGYIEDFKFVEVEPQGMDHRDDGAPAVELVVHGDAVGKELHPAPREALSPLPPLTSPERGPMRGL